ncbi:hypothetical protein BD560DRAFT_436329 [Blakeslea trispora]|nr:hypothetical protein BD560DRAFT_436329 [Blakeslea trispora]
MSPLSNDWTILEKLLLTQAVYKYGENMWFQVARVLKQHGLIQQQNIQRQPDFYSQKNCSFQYYLLIENMEAEKQVFRNDLKNDMPVVVRLAKQLYMQRVDEIKSSIQKDQDEFNQLASEIDKIKAGKWDVQLTQIAKQAPSEKSTIERKEVAESTAEMKEQPTDSTCSFDFSESLLKRTTDESSIDSSRALKRFRAGDMNSAHLSKSEEDMNEANVISTAIMDADLETVASKKKNMLDSHKIMSPPVACSNSDCAVPDSDNITLDISNETESVVVKGSENEHLSDDAELKTKETQQKEEPVIKNDASRVDTVMLSSAESTIAVPEDNRHDGDAKIETGANEETSTVSESNIQIPDELTSCEQHNLPASFKTNIPNDEYSSTEAIHTPSQSSRKPLSNNEQRQKAWQKNINLLWQEIANHKNGTMFMNPIKKSHAPLYDKVVKQPLYLKTIKNRVKDGVVKTTTEFERDITLMLVNSLMYNKEGTEMYLMAQEMLGDVREQIRLFKSADNYSTAFWENDV